MNKPRKLDRAAPTVHNGDHVLAQFRHLVDAINYAVGESLNQDGVIWITHAGLTKPYQEWCK